MKLNSTIHLGKQLFSNSYHLVISRNSSFVLSVASSITSFQSSRSIITSHRLFCSSRNIMSQFKYPATRRDESVVDDLHGHKVADPYRWLEDPDAEETKAFVTEQNKVTQSFLSQWPHRESFKKTLTNLYDYPRYGCPMQRGDKFYYFHNSGLQAQAVLYKQDSLDGEARVFLDPNTLSEDGTVSINNYSFSESGKLFAYALSASGSDWVTIHVRSTEDGAPLNLESKPIEWAKFTGIEWTKDEKGFFYNRYPKPTVDQDKAGTETDSNKNAAMYYHRIGTPQDQDLLIYSDPSNPEFLFSAEVTDDGSYLLIFISKSCDPENKVYIVDLETHYAAHGHELTSELNIQKLIDNFDAEWSYLANDGSIFYFQTTLKAPKRKIVKFDVANPSNGFIDVVPEKEHVISFASVIYKTNLVVTYLQDVKHVSFVYELETGLPTKLEQLPLPVGSIIKSFSGRRNQEKVFYSYSSFVTPGEIRVYDFAKQEGSVFRTTEIKGYDSSLLETKQVFYPSKDGTKIPMFITSKKGLELTGDNTTLLYGYGGFNISITPTFSVSWVNFMLHMNGVVCVANIRGGGEYGEAWNKAGKLKNKQNVFDDFQYAARYLAKHKYTSPSKLAIMGGSNGGLLVGACINQAPELFGCGVAAVGVMDVTRFHKFTIGHAWVSDYGNPDVKEDFEVLYKYSPLHNVNKDKEYPAVLITTGDHDDRVVPLHSLKLLATLQNHRTNNVKPIMGRIETKAGHGAGKSTQQIIEETTDTYTFIALTLNAKWVD